MRPMLVFHHGRPDLAGVASDPDPSPLDFDVVRDGDQLCGELSDGTRVFPEADYRGRLIGARFDPPRDSGRLPRRRLLGALQPRERATIRAVFDLAQPPAARGGTR